MQNTKLIQSLRLLTVDELKPFSLFLKSPYHNSNKRIIALFKALQPYHASNYESNRLQKEVLFYKIFSVDKPYHASNMRTLMSKLSQLVEAFVLDQAVRKEQVIQQQLLATAYSDRKAYSIFQKINRQQDAQLAQATVQDMEVHQQRFQLNWAYYFHVNTEKYHTTIPSLEAAMYHLDQFYLQAKFRLGLEMKNREKVLQEAYDILFWEYLKQTINTDTFLQQPLFQLHIICLQLQEQFDEQLFGQAVQFYTKHIGNLGRWEREAFLALLLNLATRQAYYGKEQYYASIHQLHLLALEKDLLLVNGTINSFYFFNISVTGLHLGKFDWVQCFIQKNKDFLPLTVRADTLKLIQALYCYYKAVKLHSNDYFDEALQHIQSIQSNTIAFTLPAKILSLKIYYDYHLCKNNNYHFFLDYTKAFQKYLNRNTQLAASKKEPYQNFLFFALKLAKSRHAKSKEKIHDLQTAIQLKKVLYGKIWLKEKIEELLPST